ncbi:hypothetical protein RCL_jg23335.t1 [Rhizophagus clarus]|uniref:Uncharacterized protein n=1 Tax=Rhizophagus clarus TaxID=94130 RepID=A0A8H3L426_9GLOM|nr:hypothetical protein RCL_jg23335.t1 [Rhizophagus clarus]
MEENNQPTSRSHLLISTSNFMRDIERVFGTSSSPKMTIKIRCGYVTTTFLFPKMKALFGLKTESYDQLPYIEIGSLATSEEIRNRDTIISVTEAKREDINQGVAQTGVDWVITKIKVVLEMGMIMQKSSLDDGKQVK